MKRARVSYPTWHARCIKRPGSAIGRSLHCNRRRPTSFLALLHAHARIVFEVVSVWWHIPVYKRLRFSVTGRATFLVIFDHRSMREREGARRSESMGS